MTRPIDKRPVTPLTARRFGKEKAVEWAAINKNNDEWEKHIEGADILSILNKHIKSASPQFNIMIAQAIKNLILELDE